MTDWKEEAGDITEQFRGEKGNHSVTDLFSQEGGSHSNGRGVRMQVSVGLKKRTQWGSGNAWGVS